MFVYVVFAIAFMMVGAKFNRRRYYDGIGIAFIASMLLSVGSFGGVVCWFIIIVASGVFEVVMLHELADTCESV